MIKQDSKRTCIVARVMLWTWVFLAVSAVFSVSIEAAGAPVQELFRPTSMQADSPGSSARVKRSRVVDINWDLVADPGSGAGPTGDFTLNLFADASFHCVIDGVKKTESGGMAWKGHLEGDMAGKVVLVTHDSVAMGYVSTPDAVYEVRYFKDGAHAVDELNPAGFPPAGEPLTLAPTGETAADFPIGKDDGTLIDVLVAYTPTARADVGSTAAMEAKIDLAETLANDSFANSGIVPRIRVVHKAEVNYSESGFSFSGALSAAKAGNISNLHALRDQYGADLVVLLVEGDNSLCGLGYLQSSVASSFADFGFTVTDHDCISNHTFVHEIGHNMGARHERNNDSTDGAPFSFNHGYSDSANNFRTIMSVGSDCSTCPRVQYWSNPDITVNGAAAGIPEGLATAADNRKTLNQTALNTSNFRDTVVPVQIFTGEASEKVIVPYWQGDTSVYTFVAVTHPSLESMSSQIGVVVNAATLTGGVYGAAAEFTVNAGETKRLFITSASNTSINPANLPSANFIQGNSSGGGQLVINPKASHPTQILGGTNVSGRGYPDITRLSFWGAIVIPQSSTGFAIEFIGDVHDSTRGLN